MSRRTIAICGVVTGALVLAAARAGHDSYACAPGNGGLTLPSGFCATVFAQNVSGARHMVVAPDGNVLVATRPRGSQGSSPSPAGVVLLRDTDRDGKADVQLRITEGSAGTGIGISGDWLYVTSGNSIVRHRYTRGATTVLGPPDTIVTGLPMQGHSSHNFLVAGRELLVNIGSQSNSCQQADRQSNSPGHDPCTELETRAGLWRFDANGRRQLPSAGRRFATGLRNTIALARQPSSGKLFATVHGRDQLFDNWKPLFTVEQQAELPAEEMVQIAEGDNFGWPYCFYDPMRKTRVTAPEYGGDGNRSDRCGSFKAPLFGFPAHWAPNGMVFYSARGFPGAYRNGAFIAFHGSWNRAPLPQAGFKVVFQPMTADGRLAGDYTVFADGFMPVDARNQPRVTSGGHRPTGLAVGPDGALYISDDLGGTIWRVEYKGISK